MPSFCIHLAIASEYMKKHKNEIKDKEEFIKGTLEPDFGEDKYISHYGNYAEKHIGLSNFLDKEKVDTDYWKGYFLHLVADELFYNNVFKKENDYVMEKDLSFYNDWDCSNEYLIKEYNIKDIPERAKKYIHSSKDKPEYIDFKRLKKFIDEISEISIEKQIEEIRTNGNPII